MILRSLLCMQSSRALGPRLHVHLPRVASLLSLPKLHMTKLSPKLRNWNL